MPILNWVGKEAVINHDKEVPFRLLKKIKSVSVGKNSQNLIIHGDNLEALKSLMPFYYGKIRCIYIDPPYNTGNEKWIYNDKVNSLKIKKWLGKVVGGESEDLCRHDKWLCMMYPRLKLLRDLLDEDGSIYINIDNNELFSLKFLCDDIFGRENQISTLTIKVKDPAGVGQQSFIFDISEYILGYAKDIIKFKNSIKILPSDFQQLNNQYGSYNKIIVSFGKSDLVKEINRTGVGRIKIYKCKDYDFKTTKSLSFREYIRRREKIFADYNPSGGMIVAIKDDIPKKGLSYLEYVPTKGRNANKKIKNYFLNGRILAWLSDVTIFENGKLFKKTKVTNIWDIPNASLHLEGGVTFTHGKKPLALVKKILSLSSYDDSLVLDSFAGSGTTGHAVMDLNKEDGGSRKFILVEMEDNIAKKITAERIKRSIKKYKYKEGFEYCELDQPLFNSEGQIDESCSFDQLATYIYFTETQTNIDKNKIKNNSIGSFNGIDYYLIFKGKNKNMLNKTFIRKLKKSDNKKVIYADKCLVDDDVLNELNIRFKQIPYQVKIY